MLPRRRMRFDSIRGQHFELFALHALDGIGLAPGGIANLLLPLLLAGVGRRKSVLQALDCRFEKLVFLLFLLL